MVFLTGKMELVTQKHELSSCHKEAVEIEQYESGWSNKRMGGALALPLSE